jgi:hypothetical protein
MRNGTSLVYSIVEIVNTVQRKGSYNAQIGSWCFGCSADFSAACRCGVWITDVVSGTRHDSEGLVMVLLIVIPTESTLVESLYIFPSQVSESCRPQFRHSLLFWADSSLDPLAFGLCSCMERYMYTSIPRVTRWCGRASCRWTWSIRRQQ